MDWADIVLVDLDHTLSDARWRDDKIKEKMTRDDWAEYHGHAMSDPCFEPVAAVVRALKLSGCMIYIVTAREERFRWATETWMRNNRINTDALFMRPNYNSEPSKTLKAKQIVHALPVEMLARVKLIIDDREDVIESFAKIGICGLRVVMS